MIKIKGNSYSNKTLIVVPIITSIHNQCIVSKIITKH